ncbi:21169_t:CDS:2, partial [Gigaspora rosea]
PDLFNEFASFNSDQNEFISTLSKLNIETANISLFEDKRVTFDSFLNNEQLYEPNMMLDDYILAD